MVAKTARIYLPRDLHRRIKVSAAKSGVSMRKFMEDLIEAAIKEEEENKAV